MRLSVALSLRFGFFADVVDLREAELADEGTLSLPARLWEAKLSRPIDHCSRAWLRRRVAVGVREREADSCPIGIASLNTGDVPRFKL